MGIDFQFIAYQGKALTDAQVAKLIRDHAPSVSLFRHATTPIDEVSDLRCIAIYEGPSDRTHTLSIADVEPRMGLPDDAPLSAVVQAAWKKTLAELRAPKPSNRGDQDEDDDAVDADADEDLGLALARELSRSIGSSFWICQGDHSCVGGYAHFKSGELVDKGGDKDVWVDGDGYIDIPAKKWSKTLKVQLQPEEIFFRAFPDTNDPPLCLSSDPTRHVDFDPAEHEVSLE